ncbi:calcium-binding protein [Tieghemostelium lacteum]|uniref:Calcium-binding protein n=1 Tax=Tieghemostelium lacteum TaxID=361077 RepID=A0A152A6Z6_TIELA|nr:calcium-binding protein [Tieghemostelium lacteum]|eukprot:KYR01905.1 calcium-binding protein [Tieghemostelium lacteum]
MGNLSSKDLKEVMDKTSYTKQDVEKLYKDFKVSDTDGKTGFTFPEFQAFFKIRFEGLEEATLKRMFDLFDSDKNGILDFKEFASALFLMTKATTEDKLAFLFDLYDTDKSGYLSIDECNEIITTAYGCSRKLGGGDSYTYEKLTSIMYDMQVEPGKGISKKTFIENGSKSDTLCTFLCFYKTFGNLLY